MKKLMNSMTHSHKNSTAACAGAAFAMSVSLLMMDAVLLVSIILFIIGIVVLVSKLVREEVHTAA